MEIKKEEIFKKVPELQSCAEAHYYSECTFSPSTYGSNSPSGLLSFLQRNDYVGSPKQAIPVDALNQIKQANRSFQEKRSCRPKY